MIPKDVGLGTKLTQHVKLEAMEKALRWVDLVLIAVVTVLLAFSNDGVTGATLGLLLIQAILTMNLIFLLSKDHKNAQLGFLVDYIYRMFYETEKGKGKWSESVDSYRSEVSRMIADITDVDDRFASYYWVGHIVVWLVIIYSLL